MERNRRQLRRTGQRLRQEDQQARTARDTRGRSIDVCSKTIGTIAPLSPSQQIHAASCTTCVGATCKVSCNFPLHSYCKLTDQRYGTPFSINYASWGRRLEPASRSESWRKGAA